MKMRRSRFARYCLHRVAVEKEKISTIDAKIHRKQICRLKFCYQLLLEFSKQLFHSSVRMQYLLLIEQTEKLFK